MGEKSSVTWIHLSDRHFTHADAEIPGALVAEMLLDDIGNRHEFSSELETIDFLFFTGDLVHSGAREEYADAYDKFLGPVIDKLGIQAGRVCMVPGNHEVHRKEDTELRRDLRKRLLSDEDVALKDLEEVWRTGEDRDIVLRVFGPYFDFVSDRLAHIARDTGGFLHVCTLGNIVVEVVGVNTAWLARGGQEEKGKLSAGLPLLTDLLGQCRQDADLRILLMHHPIDWLKGCTEEYEGCLNVLTRRVDLVLHGHLHERGYVPYLSSGATWRVQVVPGGAVYTDDQLQRFCYSYGVFKPQSRDVDIYLREYRPETVGFVPHHTFPLGVPLQRKRTSLVERSPAQRTYEEVNVPEELEDSLKRYARAHLQRIAEKSGEVAYAEVSLVEEKRFTYLDEQLLLSGTTTEFRCLRYGLLPRVGSGDLESLVPERLHRGDEADISAAIGQKILSGRHRDCLLVAGLVAGASRPLVSMLASRWRGETRQQCEQAIEELVQMQLLEDGEAHLPFSGEAVPCLDVDDRVHAWILEPENLAPKDRLGILETAVQLLDTDEVETPLLLLLLGCNLDALPSHLVRSVGEFIASQTLERMHPMHYFAAQAFVTEPAELVALARDAAAQAVADRKWLYGAALLSYATAARDTDEPLLSAECADKALVLLTASVDAQGEAATKAQVLLGMGMAQELLGQSGEASDRYAEAEEEFLKAVQVVEGADKKAEIWRTVANIRLDKLERYADATAAFTLALEANPDGGDLWRGLSHALEKQAEALERAGDDATETWRRAEENLLEALTRHESPVERGNGWSRVAELRSEKLGDEVGAQEAYGRAADEYAKAVEVVEDLPGKAVMWFLAGFIRSMRLNDHGAAEDAFRQGLELDPGRDTGWSGLALALEKQAEVLEEAGEDATGEWEEAEQNHLESLARNDSPLGRGTGWLRVAEVRAEKLGDEVGAEEAYGRAAEELVKAAEVVEDPGEKAQIWVAIGVIRSRELSDYGAAEDAFRQGLELDPGRDTGWRGVALALEKQAEALEEAGEDATREWKEAEQNHLESLARNDSPLGRGTGWLRLAEVRGEKLGDEVGAEEAYGRAAEELVKAVEVVEDPGEKVDIWLVVAFVRSKELGDHGGAVDALRNGLELDPGRDILWSGLALTLGRQAEALEEAGEDATEKWRQAEQNHLEAVGRVEDPRLRANGWSRIGELRRDKLRDEPAAAEAYGRAADELVSAIEGLDDADQRALTWVESATHWLRGAANAQRAIEILATSGLLEAGHQEALVLAVRACSKLGRHEESDQFLDQLEAVLADAGIGLDVVTRRRAWIELRRGRAAEALEIAVSITAKSAVETQRAQMISALCLWLLGDQQSSLETLGRVERPDWVAVWEASHDARIVAERYFPEVDIKPYLERLEDLRRGDLPRFEAQ
jgi:tetratricopeptide (TPR) repeat protein/calcineurin-like phosphoesterase family protein